MDWRVKHAKEVVGVKGSALWGGTALVVLFLLSSLVAGCQRAKPPRLLMQPTPASPLMAAELSLPVATSAVTVSVTVQQAYPEPSPSATLAPSPTIVPPSPTVGATPVPTFTPTLVPAGEITHVVRPGETLLSIAARYGSTLAAIMNRNNLNNPHLLRVGQVLIIPVGGSLAETPPPGTVQHIVKAGETLAQLARIYRTTTAAIRSANPGLQDPDHLAVGTVLTITIGTEPPVRTHVVRRGESLASIARRYGVSVQALVQANGLVDPNRLVVGQVLIIP